MLAMDKANAMNCRLSCEPSVASLLRSVAKNFPSSQIAEAGHVDGDVTRVEVQESLVLRPSNGVVEASDYLTEKHDWLQLPGLKREVSGS